MTGAPVFVSESFSTWTFDPSIIIPEAVREDRFTFPVEVLHAFHLQGLKLSVTVRESYSTAFVDGELEIEPTGEQEVLAIIQGYGSQDDERQSSPVSLKPGQKIALMGYGEFTVFNSN